MESQRIKLTVFFCFCVFFCGNSMMISRPVEIHVKIKNATSGTAVIDNGLKQSTLPTGKSLEVVYWRALAIVFPDGYSKEIDCFQLPEDISRKAPPQNKYRTKNSRGVLF